MKKSKITVIGSINMDLVVQTSVVPDQGETVLGEDFQTKPGGKGANQAVAAARLGADVQMIGKVGDDENGRTLLHVLKKEGISTDMVETVQNKSTGVANITVSNNDNRIIIVSGANKEVSPSFVEQFKEKIIKSDLVIMQFEIPLVTIMYCLDLCHENEIPVILNPAPTRELPEQSWEKATYITPNETEAKQLFNNLPTKSSIHDKLIVTMGEHGVRYRFNNKTCNIPSYSVQVADTTGAGDTFNGALAVALSEKQSLESAVAFANAASAISIQKFGAQGGMPNRREVERMLEQ